MNNSISTEVAIRYAIMEHVARYRMTVLPALQKIPYLKNWGRKRIGSFLRELCRKGHLECGPFYRNRRYFFLSQRGAGLCFRAGLLRDTTDQYGPLSEQAKIRNYAILAFCRLSGAERRRLTPAELERHFPGLYEPGLPMNYYVDRSSQPTRLGFIRVDTGGCGRWDRVLAKCRNDLQWHWRHVGFRQFIERGAFEFVAITPLPQKAGRLAQRLEASRDAATKLIRVCALPELLNLIAPPASWSRGKPEIPPRGFASLPVPGARKNKGASRSFRKP